MTYFNLFDIYIMPPVNINSGSAPGRGYSSKLTWKEIRPHEKAKDW